VIEIALYARVSTKGQQQSQSIEQQIERLRAAVAAQPDWHLAEEHIYRDDGYSGAKLNRPGLDRLRDKAAMAAFELVLVTVPDRLARKYVHQVLLIEELDKLGCRIEFLDRPMNSDDPHDQLLLQIRGAVAEYERNLIADRMRRGRQAKLKSGTLLPWTVAPYGYILDPERPRDPSRLRLDPVKATLIQQIFAWYTDPEKPVSLYWIAQKLSDDQIPTPRGGARWNVATIRGFLRNPAYMGTAYSGRTRPVPARRRKSALQPVGPGQSCQPTPPEEWIAIPVINIVSQETFEAAQHRLDRNKQMARRNNTAHEYLLRSLLSCAQCQLTCSGRLVRPSYAYYICRGRTDALRQAQGERCTARYIPAKALDQLVWQDLCCILTDPTLITHELERARAGEWLPQALQARRQTVKDALAQLERQQARLLEVYLAEVISRDEFDRKRQELTQTQQGLTHQLRQLEAQAQKKLDTANIAMHIQDFCQRVQPTLEQLDFAQRRQLVELLIDRVIVDDDKVEIRYVIPTSPKGEESRFCHLRKDYFDLPTERVDEHSLAQGQYSRRDVGDVDIPLQPSQFLSTQGASLAASIGFGLTSSFRNHIRGQPNDQHAAGQFDVATDQQVQLPCVVPRFVQVGQQVKPFQGPRLVEHTVSVQPAHKVRISRRNVAQRGQHEVSQITQEQCAVRYMGQVSLEALIRLATSLPNHSTQVAAQKLPDRLQLQCCFRSIPPAARELGRQIVRQPNTTAIHKLNSRELYQQFQRYWYLVLQCCLALHEHLLHKLHRCWRESFLHALFRDLHSQICCHLAQHIQTGSGVLQKSQHPGRQKLASCHLGIALHELGLARCRIRYLPENLLQCLARLCYVYHCGFPPLSLERRLPQLGQNRKCFARSPLRLTRMGTTPGTLVSALCEAVCAIRCSCDSDAPQFVSNWQNVTRGSDGIHSLK
jgi:site-specific DNA recombinase